MSRQTIAIATGVAMLVLAWADLWPWVYGVATAGAFMWAVSLADEVRHHRSRIEALEREVANLRASQSLPHRVHLGSRRPANTA